MERPWKLGAASLRTGCCSSTAPASRRTPNASRIRRRRSGSRQRMQFGGSLLLRDPGRGGTRPSHGMLSPRVEAGAFGDRAGAGRCARGVVVRQGGDLGEHWQRRDDPSAHRRKEGWAVGRRRRAAGRIGVHSSEAASCGPRPGRKVREVGRLSGATSPGPCCSRQPPRQGV